MKLKERILSIPRISLFLISLGGVNIIAALIASGMGHPLMGAFAACTGTACLVAGGSELKGESTNTRYGASTEGIRR